MTQPDPMRRELLSTGTTALAVGLILLALYTIVPGGPCVFMPIGMLGLVATATGAFHLWAMTKL